MTVSEAIHWYVKLSKDIFGPANRKWLSESKFKASGLERAVKNVVVEEQRKNGKPESECDPNLLMYTGAPVLELGNW